MPRLRTIFCATLLCLPPLALAQESVLKKADAVIALLDAYVAQHKVVGVSAAIHTPDGENWFGAGFADKEALTLVAKDTLFRLGSISKPVTAVAALKLVEEGKLSLFAKVAGFVPEWPDRSSRITLRHLLTHTSGIRHYLREKPDVYFKRFTVRESLDVFKDDAPLFGPGERVSYSTHAFSLVVRLVEVGSGEEFGSYLRKTVSQPANAPSLALEDRSAANSARSQLYGLVNGQSSRYPIAEDISWKSGGGGMEASAPDLARFGLAAMTGRLLGSQMTDFMFQRQVVDGLDTGRGLGWAIRPDGSPEHGGAQQGCRTLMVLDRKTKTVYVVMTNTSGDHPIGQLMQSLIQAWSAPGA
jgi:CubicO group peptidase (beta-lactamase class C family)